MFDRSEDVCEETLENYVIEGSSNWVFRVWGTWLDCLYHSSHSCFVTFWTRSSMTSFLEPNVCLGWPYLVIEPIGDLRRAKTIHYRNYNCDRNTINLRKVDERRNSLSLSVLLDGNELLNPSCCINLIKMEHSEGGHASLVFTVRILALVTVKGLLWTP